MSTFSDLHAFLYNLPYKPLVLGLWWAGNCFAINNCERRGRARYGTDYKQMDRFLEVRGSCAGIYTVTKDHYASLNTVTKDQAATEMQTKYPNKSLFYQINYSLRDLAEKIGRNKLDEHDPRTIYQKKVSENLSENDFHYSGLVAVLSTIMTPALLLGCYCSPYPLQNGGAMLFYHLATISYHLATVFWVTMPYAYNMEERQIQKDYPAISPATGFVVMATVCGLGEGASWVGMLCIQKINCLSSQLPLFYSYF